MLHVVTVSLQGPERLPRPSPREIAHRAAHRPWPLPRGPWIQFQSWHDLLFAHWSLPADELRRRIPSELELDLFQGRAWLGIVPFRMSGVRPRGLPALPRLSAFEELNVRTYVRARAEQERPGVWFFSLDAPRPLAVWLARAWYHLPYHHARMHLEDRAGTIHYRCDRRSGPAAEFHGSYAPLSEAVENARPGTLEHFLTERYRLYTLGTHGELLSADIHHLPWPLQRARARIDVNTMARAAGLDLPASEPHLVFARVQEVLIWAPKRVRS